MNFRWIRSGKVVGASRNIKARHSEHNQGSKLSSVAAQSSAFYCAYPSKTAEYSNTVRSGFFENLMSGGKLMREFERGISFAPFLRQEEI